MHRSTRYKKLKKIIALTLALSMLNAALFPTLTWALGSGPGQPEYASFEPVDATDMVNLLTGDFTYSLPIINVPDPQGGYPLAMFYHAGINPEQEATWLGLGWNINPGSINRNAKGIPDDWNGKKTSVISYNSPNNAYDYALSVGFGFKGIYYAGLAIDGGSYKSIGVTGQVGIGHKFGALNASAGASVGTRGVGVNGGLGISGAKIGGGVNTDYSGNVSSGVSVGYSQLAVGVSLSSSGSASYYASIENNKIGLSSNAVSDNDITKAVQGGGASFFIGPVNVGLSFNYYTYWLWKMEDKYNYGPLYIKNTRHDVSGTGGKQEATYINDSYDNPYNSSSYNNAQRQAQSNALSFPNYDAYQVSGQGIGGNISPKIFEYAPLTREAVVFSKFNNNNSENELEYYNDYEHTFTKDPNKIYFQFDYDQGGYSRIMPGIINSGGTSSPTDYTYGSGGGAFNYTNPESLTFYNISTKRAGKSKYIEYFTNAQINTNPAGAIANGFIESESQQGHRGNSELYDADGIGAFSITAEDGKTYHYSIPVYQFEEIQVFANKINASEQYIENRKLDKYAYDWLLTSVTGPDYVDRGTAGVLEDEDYGYWVKFDYGKWTDGYVWRTPHQDGTYTNATQNSPYGAYSMGRKQIYYLNSIKTKTNTAYFIKSLREDGKGKNINYRPDDEYHYRWNKGNTFLTLGNNLCGGYVANGFYYGAKTYETEKFESVEENQLLKLDKIILLNNLDASTYANALSGDNNETNNFKNKITSGEMYIEERTLMKNSLNQEVLYCSKTTINSFTSYFQENVLDLKDVQDDIANIESKALKVIEFNQNYSLCGGSPNSSAIDGGKLTLNSAKIYGHGKADILPSYNFVYNNQLSNPISYNKDNVDNWGYYATKKQDYFDKPNADAWSLNEITTPLGGKIKINYETDSYSREAAFSGSLESALNVSSLSFPGASSLKFKLTENLNNLNPGIISFTVNNYYKITYLKHAPGPFGSNGPANVYTGSNKLLAIDLNTSELTFQVNTPFVLYRPDLAKVFVNSSYNYGGGIRVKEILLNDGAGNNYKTSYSYNNPNSTLTSGVTSFAPKTEDRYIPYVYELPGPMVMYEYVTVEDKGLTNGSYLKTRYKFDVLKTAQTSSGFSMGDHFKVEDIQPSIVGNIQNYTTGNHFAYTYARSGIVTDNKAAIGRILEVTNLNKANLVQDKVSYEYQKPIVGDIKNGITQETFNDIKRYIRWDDDHVHSSSTWYITSSSRIAYPSVLKSIITESNGITNKITNTKYDFYTGIPTETQSENSSGEKYHTKTLQAYAKYGSIETDMGSKVYDVNNKNMLVQGTASYLYSGDAVNNANLLSASVQTWKKDWNYREFISSEYVDDGQADVWRKYKTYVWKADVYNDGKVASFTDFNWTSTPNAGWQKTNEVTRYDHYSQAIESKDINGNYTAVKKGGLNGNFVIASSGASNYNSFVHSSFEDLLSNNYFGGEVSLGGGEYLSTPMLPAHTGNYLVKIHGTEYGPSYSVKENLQTGRTYRASVWVHQMSSSSTKLVANLDGEDGTPININEFMNITDPRAIHAGNWILLTVNISVPQGYVHAGGGLNVYVYNPGPTGDAYIDDMRLQPVNSPVTGYVYDERKGVVTAMLDNENFATYFTYDAANRLIKTEKESTLGIKKVSESWYHYGRP